MSQTELRPVNNRAGKHSKAHKRKSANNLLQIAGILSILVLICILFTFLTPNFLTAGSQHITAGFNQHCAGNWNDVCRF